LSRYGHAYDGVVSAIRMEFPVRSNDVTIEVDLLTRETGGGPRWVYLRFAFRYVSSFRFSEGNVSYRVLGDGARVTWSGEQVTLDMDPGPNGIDEPDPDHASGFFVTGSFCYWKEEPYLEHPAVDKP